MQAQLDSKRTETAAIRSVVDKAKRILDGLGSLDVPSTEAELAVEAELALKAETPDGLTVDGDGPPSSANLRGKETTWRQLEAEY